MSLSRFNFSFLRKNIQNPEFASPFESPDPVSFIRKQISRRNFVKFLGITPVIFDPIVNALGKIISPGFALLKTKGFVDFQVNGASKWAMKESWFEGKPKIKVVESKDNIQIKLKAAKFPGTRLSADCNIQIKREPSGWTIRVKWDDLGEMYSSNFANWLKGNEPLINSTFFNKGILDNRRLATISVLGNAQIEFHPDWSFVFNGSEIIRTKIFQEKYLSNSISICMTSGKPQSGLIEEEISQESFISISKPSRPFLPIIQASELKVGQSHIKLTSFENLYFETGLSSNGVRILSCYQQKECGPNSGIFIPDESLKDKSGKSLTFELERINLIRNLIGEEEELAVLGTFADVPVQFSFNGHQFTLGNSSNFQPALEIQKRGKNKPLIHFAPALLATHLPVQNGLSVPMAWAGDQVFSLDQLSQPDLVENPQNQFRLKKINGIWKGDNNDQVIIPVLRPEDMVVLLFHFVNFNLNLSNNKIEKVANRQGYISVYFPPQCFAEEAFFTLDPNLPVKNPTDPDKGSASNDPLPTSLPIQYRMSNLSRLVFKVPSSVQSFDNDIEKLLDWTGLEMSIHPRGLTTTGNNNSPYVFQQFKPEDIQIASPQATEVRPGRLKLPQRVDPPVETPEKPVRVRPNIPERETTTEPSLSRINPSVLREMADKNNKDRGYNATRPNVVMEVPEMSVVMPALQDSFSVPRFLDTFIEAPYRLYISPNEKQGWLHENKLIDLATLARNKTLKLFESGYANYEPKTEVYELWHSRLCNKENNQLKEATVNKPALLRAVWAKEANEDYKDVPTQNHSPFRNSLSPKDRHKLVHLSSNFKIQSGASSPAMMPFASTYYPKPFDANRLFLTSYGAYMDYWGDWANLKNKPAELNILSWIHRATLGRDHYVRVVYSGYLFPFGNQASLVKITERKMVSNVARSGSTALNFQIMFIQVKEPVKVFPAFASQGAGERMHFKNIFIKNKRTPNIDKPEVIPSKIVAGGEDGAFWINVNSQSFQFSIIAEDQEGRDISFQTSLIFVSEALGTLATKKADLDKVRLAYATDPGARNYVDLAYQMMALSPPSAGKTGDTAFETLKLKLGDDPAKKLSGIQYFPVLKEANIESTAINNLTGFNQSVSVIPFTKTNDAGVFATLKTASGLNFDQGADKAGGIATPSIQIGALSTRFGPIGGGDGTAVKASGIMSGIPTFDPKDFFKDSVPKLFGAIDLVAIVKTVALSSTGADEKIPKLVQNILNQGTNQEKLSTSYVWKPDLQEKTISILTFKPNKLQGLSLTSTVEVSKKSGEASYSLIGKLENFNIVLKDIVSLKFNSVYFNSSSGKKPDVGCDIPDLKFLGILQFINVLQDLIPSDGFSDPPFLDVSPTGIDVGYTLEIPSAELGAFSLRNMKLSAILSLPLLGGDPLSFTFNFCERENPFNATVSLFGGGGFFGLTVTLAGLQKMEAAVEFGASLSINLGVASGGVYLMGGIYFAMETVSGESSLTFQGYVRMGGALSVLGLITVSLSFKMSLNYKHQADKDIVWGEATLKVKVEVLFFSKTVSMTAKRELKGAPADPRFQDLIDEAAWKNYSLAFA